MAPSENRRRSQLISTALLQDWQLLRILQLGWIHRQIKLHMVIKGPKLRNASAKACFLKCSLICHRWHPDFVPKYVEIRPISCASPCSQTFGSWCTRQEIQNEHIPTICYDLPLCAFADFPTLVSCYLPSVLKKKWALWCVVAVDNCSMAIRTKVFS